MVYDANLCGHPGDVILAPSSGCPFRYRSQQRVGESPRFPSLSLPPSSYYPILSILSVHCAWSGRISISGLIPAGMAIPSESLPSRRSKPHSAYKISGDKCTFYDTRQSKIKKQKRNRTARVIHKRPRTPRPGETPQAFNQYTQVVVDTDRVFLFYFLL